MGSEVGNRPNTWGDLGGSGERPVATQGTESGAVASWRMCQALGGPGQVDLGLY